MAFPVDLLAELDYEDIEHSAEEYMSSLLFGDPDKLEYFTLPNRRKIPVSLSSIAFVPLYGGETMYKILALFAPESQFTAVALYLADRWWAIDDVIKTAESSRQGLQQVTSLGERIVLYILNRIIYRAHEMNAEELPFLCHGAAEFAKILWKSGKAIGFYSIKPTGSKCQAFLTRCYRLPVLDTIFVRKKHRGKGYGLQMLEDFVDCFTEEALGLRYPLSPSMYAVCQKYLNNYPDDHNLLWEVEGVGHPFQRTLIADRLLAQISPIEGTDISQEDEQGSVGGESSSLVLTETESGSQLPGHVKKQLNLTELPTESNANQELPSVSTILSEELTRPPVAKRGRHFQSKHSKEEKRNIELEQRCLTSEEEVVVPKDQLNSSEPTTDRTEEALEITENQEKCTIMEEPTELITDDVVVCEIEILQPDGDEDKESSSESATEPVDNEMADFVTEESSKTEEVILSKSQHLEEIPCESPASEEGIPPKPLDSEEVLPPQASETEQASPNSEEVIPQEPSETPEDIAPEPSKTEDVAALESVKPGVKTAQDTTIMGEEEITEDATKMEEEDSIKMEDSTKLEEEDSIKMEDATKMEEEDSIKMEDATKMEEEDSIKMEDSTKMEDKAAMNDPANGASGDSTEEPDNLECTEETKECGEDDKLEKDGDVAEQNDSKEDEPVQDPAADCTPSNHNVTDPNKDALAEHTEQPDVQADEKTSDSGHESVNEEVSQHSGAESDATSSATKTDSAQQEGEPAESNAPMDLSLGPLLVIELQDVSQKQATAVNPEADEAKEIDLKDQSSSAVAEKSVDSSSEEMETEVPVVDRRNLRRKVKGNKGPPKKRSKVAA
ncbi:soluble lamin-associated protein of 75 kDa isoform X3 [Amblyraja radiata]|uniref:soluble lamin-associated protein of 75 kDa isoform X3 n=1 Tax=Amblyraja radiata TaxID=386614 RepID=UPI001403F2F4|nr:soluble lamin-associated protein of 75 kDa isoform X3 [Amblyraja radiata]